MPAYGDLTQKLPGLKMGVSEASRVSSWVVAESAGIVFGAPVFGYDGDNENAYSAKTDTQTIVFDADFVASNSIVITVNGEASTPVVFDTNQATTMDALETQLEADFPGLEATLTDTAGANRTIELFWKGTNLTVTEAVTGGASQPTGTITASTKQVFLGIALFTQIAYNDEVGIYAYQDSINVMERGWVAVETHEAVQANTDAYAVTAIGATQGKFGTSGFDTGCRFRDSLSSAGTAIVEVRGQKG